MDRAPQPFSFLLKTDLRFGVGEIKKLPEHLRAFQWQRIAVVVDQGPAKQPAWQDVMERLRKEFTVVVDFVATIPEPTYDDLDNARRSFMNQAIDGFVVVGGGSTLDLGKALSLLVTNPEPAIAYRGFDKVKQPGPPIIAIPTTAGTGSEVTPNAVFTDAKEQRKFGINTALYLPKLCILDPLLTASCPRAVKVSSGMDALVHAHESFVSKKATPITRVLAKEAIRLVFNALKRSADDLQDMEAHGNVQLGSYLAGIALFNSSAGPTGAMSYPLGVHFKVPHGIAGAVFLPYITQHNVDRGYTGYAELYALLDQAPPAHDPARASILYSAAMRALTDALGVPRDLKPFGFSRGDIPRFVEQAGWLQGAFDMNPVPFTTRDMQTLLETMSPN